MHKINRDLRERLLDYLVSRLSAGASFKRALSEYIENYEDKLSGICTQMIVEMDDGSEVADLLLAHNVINENGYTIIKSGIPLDKAIAIIRDQTEGAASSLKGFLAKAILSPLLTIAIIVAMIEYVQPDLATFVVTMASVSKQAGAEVVSAPAYFMEQFLLTKYVLVGVAILAILLLIIGYLSKHHRRAFYKIYPPALYEDFTNLFLLFSVLTKAGLSQKEIAKRTSEHTHNQWFAGVLEDYVFNSKKGERLTDAMTENNFPKDVVAYFKDVDVTGNGVLYYTKGYEYAKQKAEHLRDVAHKMGLTINITLTVLIAGYLIVDLIVVLTKISLAPVGAI